MESRVRWLGVSRKGGGRAIDIRFGLLVHSFVPLEGAVACPCLETITCEYILILACVIIWMCAQ